MTQAKLAAIVGATRGQGLSIVNALLTSGRYTIRGVTVDPDNEDAARLRARGIDVVRVDLDDPQSIASAFKSAAVIFGVTTMYNGDMEREVSQGKNIADAAAAALDDKLEHFVWSTLPSATAVSEGRIHVPHMDGKARVDDYIINNLPMLAKRTTFYWGGFYGENVTYPAYAANLLQSAGKQVWLQPVKAETIVPMVGDHTVNSGLFVQAILRRPQVCCPAQYVLGVVEWVGHGDLLRSWGELLAEKTGRRLDAVYVQSDINTVGKIWPGMGKELGQMLAFSEAFGRQAWTKRGVALVTMQDLDLRIGGKEGDLVSMEETMRRLASKM